MTPQRQKAEALIYNVFDKPKYKLLKDNDYKREVKTKHNKSKVFYAKYNKDGKVIHWISEKKINEISYKELKTIIAVRNLGYKA